MNNQYKYVCMIACTTTSKLADEMAYAITYTNGNKVLDLSMEHT